MCINASEDVQAAAARLAAVAGWPEVVRVLWEYIMAGYALDIIAALEDERATVEAEKASMNGQ